MTPKIEKNATIMPFSTLLISLRFPSIFFFGNLEASTPKASASSETFGVWIMMVVVNWEEE